MFDTLTRMGASAAGAYEIERSLRFNSADSPYLTWTPSSSGNQQVMTWSFWYKRSSPGGAAEYVITAFNGTNTDRIAFANDDQLHIELKDGSATEAELHSKRLFRDPSAWYHIVIAFDTTDGTTGNRCKAYVNNELITDWDTENTIGQNYSMSGFNTASRVQDIGAYSGSGGSRSAHCDGYMAELHFIDGQQLTPSSFGETDEDTGQWIPKKFAGTYGNEGYYLDFSDNSNTTATTLGKDSSGNGNNWTPNNFSVAAGVGNDSFTDTPTNNFCTMNPLTAQNTTVSNGALTIAPGGNNSGCFSTMQIPTSGKWYFELKKNSGDPMIGYSNQPSLPRTWQYNNETDGMAVYFYGNRLEAYHGGSTLIDVTASPWNSDADGTVFGILWDRDNNTVKHRYDNGSEQSFSEPTALRNKPLAFGYAVTTTWPSGNFTYNFGASGFAYTIPTGYQTLCTANLPEPTIKNGGDYFNTITYTGADPNAAQSITGVGFQPNLIWIKSRTTGYGHCLVDSIRGANARLQSDTNAIEASSATYLSSIDSNGFSLGTDYGQNAPNEPYVAWNWKESATAGFDIVSYTGTGSNTTVSHGLGVAADVVLVKNRGTSARIWLMYHSANTADPETDYLQLDDNAATGDDNSAWNDTAPTSSVFSVGTSASSNNNTEGHIAYCWSEVEGYSKFGTYTGNGNADGTFIYLGFKPTFFMWKITNDTGGWGIIDAARDPINDGTEKQLGPDDSDADGSYGVCDFLSNGVKMRNTYEDTNGSGDTMIYMAFAERPFKYANAR